MEGPLDAAFGVEVLIAFNSADIAGLAFTELLHDLEGGFGVGPLFEHGAAAPSVGEELDDAKVREGLAGGVADLLESADAALGIDEGALLLAPCGGGEEEVGGLCGFGGVIHVLHHEEVELLSYLMEFALIDPRVRRVSGDDPEAFNFSGFDAINDLVVGPAGFGGDVILRDVEDAGDLFTILWLGEVVAAEEVGGV